VVLTGFMGTGKTTVGRLLATLLDYDFIDTDELIETRHGSIADIFEQEGQVRFRSLERSIAQELAEATETVIATGGRMMLDPDNARRLGEGSHVFCLIATPAAILERVETDDAVRPILAGDNPASAIESLLAERHAGYSEFHPIETTGRTPIEIAAEIVRFVRD